MLKVVKMMARLPRHFWDVQLRRSIKSASVLLDRIYSGFSGQSATIYGGLHTVYFYSILLLPLLLQTVI